jgi:hypothetical protein
MSVSMPCRSVERKRRVPFSDPPHYPVGLDRVTPDQTAKVRDALGPARRYLDRLIERMDHPPIRSGDPNLDGSWARRWMPSTRIAWCCTTGVADTGSDGRRIRTREGRASQRSPFRPRRHRRSSPLFAVGFR